MGDGIQTRNFEIYGGPRSFRILDSINAVEESLAFKAVLEDNRVPLVATHFHGRAFS